MKDESDKRLLNRRGFMKWSFIMAVGGKTLLTQAAAEPREEPPANLIHRNERPTMAYHRLGRTNFMSSRLVFGGGSALSGGKGVRLLDRAFEAGINHYDLGSDQYYKGAERHFAPFLKAHRQDIWVVSKAIPVMGKTTGAVTPAQARQAAAFWSKLLDGSLRDLRTDYIDAYYLMAVSSPSLIRSDEMYSAFLKAKESGKVGHFGVSTHENAAAVLEAMIETGWYDVAMLAITPAGWYDWSRKALAQGTPALVDLAPILKRAEEAGIGLIGMKTVRHLAMMGTYRNRKPDQFDHLYSGKLMEAPLNAFQRAYAYALENGLHVVNADMQNFRHLEQNITAAATSRRYFA